MPSVPQYGGQQVAARELPGVQQRSVASPEVLSNGQFGQMAQVAQDVGGRIEDLQNADKVMQAETALRNEYGKWSAEAKNAKGQNAWGLSQKAGQWWDDQASKLGEGLDNDKQKMALRLSAEKFKAATIGDIAGHEARERNASLESSAKASIVGAINLAAESPMNRDLQVAAKGEVIKKNAMLAQVNGWAPEVHEAMRVNDLTNMHKQVLQSLVAKDPGAAQAYFEANKGEIAGAQQAELGEFARKATATKVGEVMADAAWSQLGPKGDRDPVELDKMEAALRARPELKDNPEGLKAAIAGLRDRTAAFKDSRKERDQQNEAVVNQALLQGAGQSQIQRMPEFLRMDGEAQRKLIDFVENRQYRNTQRAIASANLGTIQEQRHQQALNQQMAGAYFQYSDPAVLAKMSDAQVVNLLP